MFTGLIQQLGKVKQLRKAAGSSRLTLELGPVASDLETGESVAVNGACLTLVSTSGGDASFDVVQETLDRTGLGKLKLGDAVNIERALRAGDRLGGHFVQGHVDGIGTISGVTRDADSVEIEISAPPDVMQLIVPKGSVAVDGISLTIARRKPGSFTIAVIPHTLDNTTLGLARPGNEVNLETDILGKYIKNLLGVQEPSEEKGLSERLLRDTGFI